MIDATHLKAAGWQRVVAELTSSAPDDRAFMDRLLRILTQVSAARQAVLFVPISASGGGQGGEGEAMPIAVFPAGAVGAPPAAGVAPGPADVAQIQSLPEVKRAALAALESSSSHVFAMEDASELYDGAGGAGYVLSLALPGEGGRSAGAITLLVEPRSRQAIQSTLAMAEVIAGYVHTHAVRQELKRNTQSTRALDLATRLIGAINSAQGFKGAAIQTVNDLAKTLGADRVAMGWLRGNSVRVIAISDTEHFDRRMTMVQKMQAAMDECLDQDQAVVHPVPPADQDVLLSQAISHAHKELASGEKNLHVCSIPMRAGEDVLGVITIESRATPDSPGVDLKTVELLQATMDLVSPVMRVRRSDDRILPLRVWDSMMWTGSWLVGPKHTAWKLAGVALIVAMIVVTVFTAEYRIGAAAELRPREKRALSMPFDGVIKKVMPGIEPGASIQAGQLLAELDDSELRLQAEESRSQMLVAQKTLDTARAQQNTGEAKKAEAQIEQARARLALLESRLERTKIVAPIGGTLISGDLKNRVGSTVKLGEGLFEIAPLDEMIAVVRVDESDVALIKEGGKGAIVTRTHPGTEFPVTIERIVPLAEAKDGKNLFEVRVKLDESAAWMRPGMGGRVSLDTGRRTLLEIGTRRIIDTVRLWLW